MGEPAKRLRHSRVEGGARGARTDAAATMAGRNGHEPASRRLGEAAGALDTHPMEAKLVDDLPRGRGWQFEPKWDGFRCLAFRTGDDVALRAKSGKPLARYFPEMVAHLRALVPERFVLDGEL